MTNHASDLLHRVVDQATGAAKTAREQAAERSGNGADRARATGTSLLESAREQLPRIQQRVSEQAEAAAKTLSAQAHDVSVAGGERARDVTTRVNEDVLPTLRDVALNAASAAVELWEAARGRAVEAAKDAQEEIAPAAAQRLAAGGERAKEASHVVADRVTDAAGQAKDASRHAAEATVTTSRDAGATLLWGAAAAGIIYYAMMDKERREQVLRTLDGIVGTTRELIRDVRGYDADF